MSEAPQWLATVPEDIRSDPSLQTVPDVPTLAKNYLNSQKLIGTKRLEEPQANWKPEQYDAFWKTLGRPETPDKYTLPKVELPKGLEIDQKRLESARTAMHKAGLTDKQAGAVLEYYFGDLKGAFEQNTNAATSERAAAENALKSEWGEKYKANVDIAKSVINQFGGEDFVKYLDESGYGNDPQMVKFLAKIGAGMLEDQAQGKGGDLKILNSTRAKGEITGLYADKEFMAAYMSKTHPGHQGALDRMSMLQRAAIEKD